MGARLFPILLLVGSNIFMTFAWYGHLKFKEARIVEGDPGQLGHRVVRVLPASPRQPPRLENLLTRPAKGDPGSHHP